MEGIFTTSVTKDTLDECPMVYKPMEEIIANLSSKFAIISYNSEGFIKFDEMKTMLEKYGKVKTVEITYNTFRGSRNLRNRDIHVSEYLFVLEK